MTIMFEACGAGMEHSQMPDSGLPGGAVHHLLNDSPAHLPSAKSSMLSRVQE